MRQPFAFLLCFVLLWGSSFYSLQGQTEALQYLCRQKGKVSPLNAEYLGQSLNEAEVKALLPQISGPDWALQTLRSPEAGGATYALDMNGDRKTDMILQRAAFVGPSWGFRFYPYMNGKYQYLYGGSGSLVEMKYENGITRFIFAYNVLKEGETGAVVTLKYFHADTACKVTSKVYYALQTEFPETIDGDVFGTATTAQNRAGLRFSPKINSGYVNTFFDFENSKTLFENIVCQYPKVRKAQILFETPKRDWFFVLYEPTPFPIQTSLAHSQDKATAEPKPYYAGWLTAKQLEGIKAKK